MGQKSGRHSDRTDHEILNSPEAQGVENAVEVPGSGGQPVFYLWGKECENFTLSSGFQLMIQYLLLKQERGCRGGGGQQWTQQGAPTATMIDEKKNEQDLLDFVKIWQEERKGQIDEQEMYCLEVLGKKWRKRRRTAFANLCAYIKREDRQRERYQRWNYGGIRLICTNLYTWWRIGKKGKKETNYLIADLKKVVVNYLKYYTTF